MDKENTFPHLMVDIETMGNQSFSSILSIAAVEYDINTGETGAEFYTNIDLQSCLNAGLKVNASTVMWWMQQNEQARQNLVQGKKAHIAFALKKFTEFCHQEYQVWANAAKFDLGILENAYNKLDMRVPWHYRKERCVRTLAALAPAIRENHTFQGTPHNALHDCYFQIGYCSKIWQTLKPAQTEMNQNDTSEPAETYSRFARRGRGPLSASQMKEICSIKGTGPSCSYMFTEKELQQFCRQLCEEK